MKREKRLAGPALWLAGLVFICLLFLAVRREMQEDKLSLRSMLQQGMAEELEEALYRRFTPSFSFLLKNGGKKDSLLEGSVTEILPLYGYAQVQAGEGGIGNTEITLEEILLEEAREGSYEAEESGVQEEEEAANLTDPSSMEELLQAENAAAVQTAPMTEQVSAFVPRGLQVQVDLEPLQSYETLVKTFYAIDANTMAGSDQLNLDALLNKDMTINKSGDAPQILIYHTHSQEAFADSIPGDPSTSIMGVGERLGQILEQQYGYKVLHHKGQYDVESRDDAYSRALPAIEQVLADNPSIQVIIDLHRDEMAEETRLVMDLDGRPTARFMFFNGLSRTRKTGDISYLYNENQADNLAFSFQMQLKAAEYYPGLTRKIYLKGYRYNMHLRPRTLLVELGAQNNTVEEAMNACDPLAHILDMVLSGE